MFRAQGIFIVIGILFSLPAFGQRPPEISLDDDGLAIREIPAGASVGVIGIGRDRHGPFPVVLRDAARLEDDDGDGRLLYAPAIGRPARSLWVAVSEDGLIGIAGRSTPLGDSATFSPEVAVEDSGRGVRVRVRANAFTPW